MYHTICFLYIQTNRYDNIMKIEADIDNVGNIYDEITNYLEDLIIRYNAKQVEVILVLSTLSFNVMRQSGIDKVLRDTDNE